MFSPVTYEDVLIELDYLRRVALRERRKEEAGVLSCVTIHLRSALSRVYLLRTIEASWPGSVRRYSSPRAQPVAKRATIGYNVTF